MDSNVNSLSSNIILLRLKSESVKNIFKPSENTYSRAYIFIHVCDFDTVGEGVKSKIKCQICICP